MTNSNEDQFHIWKTGDDIQFTKHFNSKEFECPKAQEHKISKDLVERLEKLREAYGDSIKITSGYRTPEHNAEVGGVKNSQHVLGEASDLTCSDLDKLYELCITIFNAVGDGRNHGHFIHVDVRELSKGVNAPLKFSYGAK